MKVLLVSACELPYSFNRFFTTFRSKIGTCEVLLLPKQSYIKQKQLFEQYRNSMLFDRFVAYYECNDDLSVVLSMFSGMKQQTLLCLQPEQASQQKMVAKYARSNPWVRWAGSSRTSFEFYKRIGMDAHLLSPMSIDLHANNKGTSGFRCHILGNCNTAYQSFLPDDPAYCHYNCVGSDLLHYIRNEVKEGDVVLITKQAFLERQLVADAATNGAIVVVPTSEVSLADMDELVRSVCITIDHPDELLSLFEQIRDGSNHELLGEIAAHRHLFSPEAVAIEFERLVSYPGRDRGSYVRRSTWL